MIYIRTRVSSETLIRSPNYFNQTRFLRSTSTAKTRLENRTRDTKLDHLARHTRKVQIIMDIHELMRHRKRGPFVSLQIMSRWKHLVGLNVAMGRFIHKYPHVFEVFIHPIKNNLCCRVTKGFRELMKEENKAIKDCTNEAILRVKKLLLMSKNRALHVHALSLIRRELGLPKDFRTSVLKAHEEAFKLVEVDMVELVESENDEDLRASKVEEFREREFKEKWLSESETKYAFPINYPTGFKLEGGSREKMRNWQRVPYVKPYEKNDARKSTLFESTRFEKRVVGILHEFLSLTIEKNMKVERFAHFKRDLGLDVNVREVLLKHPGIFYISTKGTNPVVFLRDGYKKGALIEGNFVHSIREKMLNAVLLGCRGSKNVQFQDSKTICKAVTQTASA